MRHRKPKIAISEPNKITSYNPRLFGDRAPTINQSVTIVINEEQDDDVAECLSGCLSFCCCLGKTAAKAATN